MRFIILISLFLAFSNILLSQKLNRSNKNGERTGKWIIYADDENKIKYFEGHFKNGVPKGKNYYYNPSGILDRKETNRFNKIKTVCYFPNGRIRQKGRARIENLKDEVHYYYYGKWTVYNDSNVKLKYNYYKKGKIVKTTYVNKNIKTNDSLIEELNQIDKQFVSYNKMYNDSINLNLKNKTRKSYFENKLRYQDSIAFKKMTNILDVFGYPSKEIAGESNSIPFYIIGYAPLTIKEKYLNTFILAADRDYISWKSLAFYIDKILISKNEKQLYGTQGNYDKDNNYILFPCQNPETLNQRREKIGLDSL
jgi:hypothetical protein